MLIRDLVGGAYSRDGTQLFGIEVELENVRFQGDVARETVDQTGGLLQMVDDGSLRNNGAEFITAPLSLDDLGEPLLWLYRTKERNGWTGGPRCGIHIHMDMRHRTIEQVLAICTAYAAVEPAIFEWCGTDREENIYCVPWYRANDNDLLRACLAHDDPRMIRRTLRDNICKYTAFNAQPLQKFGTLEFRGAPVFDTAEETLRLVDAFQRLIFEAEDLSPGEIVEMFEDDPEFALGMFWPGYDRAVLTLDEVDSIGVAAKFVRTNDGNWDLPPQAPPIQRPPPRQRRDGQRIERGVYHPGEFAEVAIDPQPARDRELREALRRMQEMHAEEVAANVDRILMNNIEENR